MCLQTNGELKRLIGGVRVEEGRVRQIMGAYNLAALVRRTVERCINADSDEPIDRARQPRDDAATSTEIARLSHWLSQLLSWDAHSPVTRTLWQVRAARDVPLTYALDSEPKERKTRIKTADSVVQRLGAADVSVLTWLGGCVSESKVWLEHEWDDTEDSAANKDASQ
jgi:hypothetical protein